MNILRKLICQTLFALLLISEKATEMVNILKGNIEDQNEKIS
jgi:hypothetical protein